MFVTLDVSAQETQPGVTVTQPAEPQTEPAAEPQNEPAIQPATEPEPTASEAPLTTPSIANQSSEATEIVAGEEAADEEQRVLPHDLSPWGMFMAADWVVKAVMIGLAIASLVTWTVWIAKSLELKGAQLRARRALKGIVEASTLAQAAEKTRNRKGPGALMVRAAMHEVEMSQGTRGSGTGEGLKERIASHLGRIEAQAARSMTRGTGILASIGSTAPFVGLFGTVWGIMNAFIGISEAQTTNLAVVAPGIAEALLATALGLVAAIPAVVIYNSFARSIAGYKLLLADASAAVERVVSRDIDRDMATAGAALHKQAAE
ncbi:tonB-system energizer ExbB [Aquamicrobium segne]|uniref:Biopolymer transport protein ExbB n=1 Tax=Aquamicrobium segne TaxID=469547 RepID=A0ABW0H4K8_9HYPH